MALTPALENVFKILMDLRSALRSGDAELAETHRRTAVNALCDMAPTKAVLAAQAKLVELPDIRDFTPAFMNDLDMLIIGEPPAHLYEDLPPDRGSMH